MADAPAPASVFVETQRTKQARAMRAAGMTLSAIGARLGLSKERTRQIISIAEQIERGEREPTDRTGPSIGRVEYG